MSDQSETEIQRLVLAQCVASKQSTEQPVPARALYDSDLWDAQAAYADALADHWYILSAKHGLLHPATEIGLYDESLRDMTADERDAWGERVVDTLADRIHFERVQRVDVLAGRLYADPIIPSLEAAGLEVVEPLAGLPGVVRGSPRVEKLRTEASEAANQSLEGYA